MRYPAAFPAAALAAGIAFGIFQPVDLVYVQILAVFAWTIAFIAFQLRCRLWGFIVVVGGFALHGALLGAGAHRSALAAPVGEAFDRHLLPNQYQAFAEIAGTIASDVTRSPNGVTLRIDTAQIRLEGEAFRPAAGGVTLGIGGTVEDAQIEQWRDGRRVRVQATVRRPAVYLNPGVRDARRDFAWRGISLVGSVKSPLLVDVTAHAGVMREFFSAVRWSIRHNVSRCLEPWSPRSAAVVTAILIGDRAGLDDEMQRQLQDAGTYHVIAISGGNIAILAGLCIFLLRLAGVGPRPSALIVIFVLIAYAFIVGRTGGASVGRATLMAVLYFAAQCLDHRSGAGNVAAVSAGLLFCAAPLEVVDAGFALTFGATLGLILGMARLGRPSWMPGWLFAGVALFAASVCAEIALLPVGAFVFSRVTAAGLILNFAAIPLMSLVQIAGTIAVALDWADARVASVAGFVAHLGVRGLLATAALVEFAPWAARRVPPPPFVLIGAYYVCLIATLSFVSRTRILFASGVAICGWLMVTTWSPASTANRPRLSVTFFDVGQGDAALAQFPDGRTLAIDAGGLAGTSFDIGARVVSPALWALGIRRLSFLAISHGDPDHLGGAASVFRDFHPKQIWEGVPVPRHEPTRALRKLARNAGAEWRTIRAGDELAIDEVRVSIRHPPPPDWERQKVRNDDSEVIELRYGDVSFVFTGDIGREVESGIAKAFPPAGIRILKVPHHGSGTSSSMEFLEALRPDVAVISAGRGNPFGHPAPAVLRRYASIGAAVFRTDQDGAISVVTDGHTVNVSSFLGKTLQLEAVTATTKITKMDISRGH